MVTMYIQQYAQRTKWLKHFARPVQNP